MLLTDPNDVQRVKDALKFNVHNIGIGILHEPSGQIFLASYDDLGGGHDILAGRHHLLEQECKGFAVRRLPDGSFDTVNISHLNGPQGQPGSLQMDALLFHTVVAALRQAGL